MIKWHEFICIVLKYGEIRSSNPIDYDVRNDNFCDNMAKIAPNTSKYWVRMINVTFVLWWPKDVAIAAN